MPTKKKTSSRARGRAHVKADRAQAARKRIRETWNATVRVLTSAEAGAERRLRQLLARKRIKPADLRTALAAFRARVQKEQRKAAREIESRLSAAFAFTGSDFPDVSCVVSFAQVNEVPRRMRRSDEA